MASTYSTNLRLELIGTGEQQGTWGTTTNTNLGTLLEEAIGGYVSVTVLDVGDTTLTTSNGAADQSRNMVIELTGTISAARNVICPAIEKVYIVKNATTGGYAITFKVSGQTGISVPNGATVFLYVDGTDARLVSVAPSGGSYGTQSQILTSNGTSSAPSWQNKVVVSSTTSTTSPWAWSSNGYDQFAFTALANNLTINADSGSPVDGQRVAFRFKPNTAVTLTWTTGTSKSFRVVGNLVLPTSLVSGKTSYVGCIYNSADTRWDVVAVTTEP